MVVFNIYAVYIFKPSFDLGCPPIKRTGTILSCMDGCVEWLCGCVSGVWQVCSLMLSIRQPFVPNPLSIVWDEGGLFQLLYFQLHYVSVRRVVLPCLFFGYFRLVNLLCFFPVWSGFLKFFHVFSHVFHIFFMFSHQKNNTAMFFFRSLPGFLLLLNTKLF